MTDIRNTQQREMILKHLKSVHNHPTAEIVFKAVSKSLPKITLATVYRNLNLLAEQGEILRLEINKEYHYDAYCKAHQHCVCESCGEIKETFDDDITKYATKKLKAKGFNVKSVNLMFTGCCDKCNYDENCDCTSNKEVK